MNFEIDCFNNIRTRRFELVFWRRLGAGLGMEIGMPVKPEWQQVMENEAMAHEPTLEVDVEAMESLLTNLWQQGIRPKGWENTRASPDVQIVKDYERQLNKYRKDIGRERDRLHRAEKRLDRALEIIEMGPSYKGRVKMKPRGNGNGEEAEEDT